MPTQLEQLSSDIELITFDCYGTLIDWQAGMAAALAGLALPGGPDAGALVEAYVAVEAEVEAGPYLPYRAVQAATLGQVAERFGLPLDEGEEDRLSRSLPDWPPFADTVDALHRLQRRYRLGVLSNIDRDLFAGTAKQLGVSFDVVVTAEDVCSYKPRAAHFTRMLDQTRLAPSRVLHAAQSLFHDAGPAAACGMPFIWINRYADAPVAETARVAEVSSLADLAGVLGVG